MAEQHPDLPVPKFKIGDVVYVPGYNASTEEMTCPDCHGTKVWTVKTAAEEFETPCQRCSTWSSKPPTLPKAEPTVQRVTIATVRSGSHPEWGDGDKVTYMSSKTGSGTVYRESRCHATEAEAMAVARVMAAEQTKKLQDQDHVKERKRHLHLPIMESELKEAQTRASNLSAKLSILKDNIWDLVEWKGYDPKNRELLDEVRRGLLGTEDYEAYAENERKAS